MIKQTLSASNGMTLVRATADKLEAVEDLQQTAYAYNRELLGVEPLPLLADYSSVLRTYEVWIKEGTAPDGGLDAALILDTGRTDDILIWSVATSPVSQKLGLGYALLDCAEQRARQLGRDKIRLYTGQPLTHLIAWYSRNGYIVERVEEMPDRTAVHMIKHLT